MDNGVVVELIGLLGVLVLAWVGYRVVVKARVDVFHHRTSGDETKREGAGESSAGAASTPLAFPDEPSGQPNSGRVSQSPFDIANGGASEARRGPKTRPPSERFSAAATGVEPPILDKRPIEPGDYAGLTGSDLDARFISDYDWLDHEGGSFTVYRSER